MSTLKPWDFDPIAATFGFLFTIKSKAMASLKGPFLFTGSIGNIKSSYNSKLKRYILSTKGGPSAELIKNSPAFARTRENMQEFKACGKFSSQLRKTLLLLSPLFDGYYFSELVRMAKEIQLIDERHPKGFRSIEASKMPWWLTRLNFNRKHPFDSVFWGNAVASFGEDRQRVTLELKDFTTSRAIHWPARFASCRISLLIGQLSDWVYDPVGADFVPVVPDLEQRSVMVQSEWLPNSCEAIDLVITAAFGEAVPQTPGTVVVVAMGVEVSTVFAKAEGGARAGMGTMRIVEGFGGIG